jgi:hypothetical protein
VFLFFLLQTPLRALRPGEILLFFLSQRRQERQELRVLVFLAPNTFAYFAPWREYIVFISRRGAETAEKFNVYLVPAPTPLRTLRLGESILFFFSRKGAKAAK